ncbi:MAG TPA: sugar phosphate nucleotidyltransferase, partial [Phnomibacter sp.]|nr:sugar phosphate nucleotidyltransferase [Phnomibacter sp.]
MQHSPLEATTLILLAGGAGSRLLPALPNTPKCLAPVNGVPLLHYQIRYWTRQGITQIILATGHGHSQVAAFVQWLQPEFPEINFVLSPEDSPLGTGGALKKAIALLAHQPFWVANADSLFLIDVQQMEAAAKAENHPVTIAALPLAHADRFGTIQINKQGQLTHWAEKGNEGPGLINGGIYRFAQAPATLQQLPVAFSLEEQLMPMLVAQRQVYAHQKEAFFADMGTPQAFAEAQHQLPKLWPRLQPAHGF